MEGKLGGADMGTLSAAERGGFVIPKCLTGDEIGHIRPFENTAGCGPRNSGRLETLIFGVCGVN